MRVRHLIWIPLLFLWPLAACEFFDAAQHVVQDPAVQQAGGAVIASVGTGNPVTIGLNVLTLVNTVLAVIVNRKATVIDNKRSQNTTRILDDNEVLRNRVTALEAKIGVAPTVVTPTT